MACPLATERVWIEKAKYHDAEKDYFEHLSKLLKGSLSSDKNLEEIVKNSTSEATEILKMQQDHEILEQQQQTATVLKPKKSKKDKLKAKQQLQQQQQQQQQIEELSQHDDSIKTDVSLNENSSSITANVNSNGVGADDESKTKKKKKKKNKSSTSSSLTEANKMNENHQNKTNDIGNNNTATIAVVSASNQDADQDQKIPNNSNKKNDSKQQQQQQQQQRPTNIKNLKGSVSGSNQNTLVSEIAKARQHIKSSLEKMDGIAALAATPVGSPGQDVFGRLEKENASLRELIEELMKSQIESEKRIKALETKLDALSLSQGGQVSSTKKPSPAPVSSSKSAAKDDDDDGVDLFASESEEEDEEAAKVREQRLAEYAAKKSKKPTLIAKSNVILDVKPWDDETDLKQMEAEIRKIATDGLLWGVSKFVPVAFGIKKLSIACVVEDEKVSIDWLQEEIEKLEDYVQSVDVAAFNKI